jgi:hypothetical protein
VAEIVEVEPRNSRAPAGGAPRRFYVPNTPTRLVTENVGVRMLLPTVGAYAPEV